jgi:SAM-dependent methyltransferase
MTILYEKDWINEEWFTPDYQARKRENFELANQYLDQAPRTILDIGCGLAWESRLFNQHHGSQLFLLDGDYDDNDHGPLRTQMQARYCENAKDFAYYYRLDYLRAELDKLETQNYHLIDCNHIDIDNDVTFDLITSWVSCGFHYPASTYRDLIVKHSHADTVVIMDLRILAKAPGPIVEPGVEIVHVLNRRPKYATCHVRFT